jgi:alkylation response protein AidB-like acyl-CoA dehydrogenase
MLSGRASWVGPLTRRGVAVLGVRRAGREGALRSAVVIGLEEPGVTVERVQTAALSGFVCGHLSLRNVPFSEIGSPIPIMARVRILLAAAGLGMGRRALREAVQTTRRPAAGESATGRDGYRGAGGEQSVQGLLADAATELDAAEMLVYRAATQDAPQLPDASMAKLAATEATQRAGARATQIVGAESFRSGHIVERLAQDVRALELFAGRTEALREAVAEATLPRT